MFANKFVRIILISLVMFILVINIYMWATGIQVDENFRITKDNYVGFTGFFNNFSRMPKFEFFVDSLQDVAAVFTDWSSTLKSWLAAITLGLSVIVDFTINVTKVIISLVIEFFRYIFWLLGFLGVEIEIPTSAIS